MKIGKEVTVFDKETGEILKHTVTYGSQNGDDWVIMYRKALENLIINAPSTAYKVFGLLSTRQKFEGGINITKQAVANNLKMSYQHIWESFKWLKENGYVKEAKIDGQTQFFLNPHVTSCGKNRKAKIEQWNSLP